MGVEVDEFRVRSSVAFGVRAGRVVFVVGALWCVARALMEAQEIGFGISPWAYVAGVVFYLVLSWHFRRIRRRLGRPAVRISHDELEWGSVNSDRRRRLAIRDLRGVRSAGLGALWLDTHSGDSVRMITYEVDPDERMALRAAIERRILPEPG